MSIQNYAKKITAILAKAESTNHEAEAEVLMEKAHKLMMEHGITLLDLGKLHEDPVGVNKNAVELSASYPWMRRVANQLGRYYGCKVVYVNAPRNKVLLSVVGRESARITWELLVPFVQKQIQALAREAYKEGRYSSRMQAVTRIGNATAIRIAKLADEMRSDTRIFGTGVNALVPVDIIDNALAEAFPGAVTTRSRAASVDDYAREAAKKVNFDRQMGRASATRMIGK